METNILVKPYTPANLILLVNRQLFSEKVIPLLIDRLVVLLIRTGIDGSKLSIPDRNTVTLHELNLPLIRLLQNPLLLRRPDIRLASRKSHGSIVMDGIHTVRQHLLKRREIHGIRVPVEVKNMLRIHLPNRRLHPAVESLEIYVFRVRWFVHGVITRNPRISPVMLRNLDPEIDHPVLEILEVPEEGLVDARVAVPALVLAAGEGVHVDDGV